MTIDADNLLWLRGRAASLKRRSLSEALDEILTAARTGARGGEAGRSVVGTIDIAADDPALRMADASIGQEIQASLARPLAIHDPRASYGAARKTKTTKPAGAGKRTRA